MNGPHQARRCWNIVRKQAAENVKAGGVCDRFDCVYAAFDLRVAAGEIDRYHWLCGVRSSTSAGRVRDPTPRNRHCDLHRLVADAVVVQKIFRLIRASRYLLQKCAHQFFGILHQFLRRVRDLGDAVSRTHFPQSFGAGVASGDLRAQVAFTLFRRAYVVEQKGQYIAIHHAFAHEAHGRNAKTFLVNLAA